MSESPAFDGEVEIGERVTVLDLTTAAVTDYRIGAELSPDSRLGSALLGRHVGDIVQFADRRLEIVEIDG